jgi:nucleoside-diphosphate-sugar epimerase
MPEPAPRGGSDQGGIFLTGATGFIGRRIQQRLLDDGWWVRVLCRPDSAGIGNLDIRAERIDGALDDQSALTRAVIGTTAVINCAGSVRGLNYAAFEPANVAGVANLCAALTTLDAPPPLLHLSSLAASEPGLSDYARSKWAGEQVLHEHPSLCWTIIRPPAVYGPGDREMRAALGWARRGIVPVAGADPQQRLSMLHVDDLAAAVTAWLESPASHQHRTYAIDDGKPDGYDWYEFAAAIATRRPRLIGLPTWLLDSFARVNEALAGLTGRAIMLSRGKVRELTHPRWVADNGPFCSSSGWQPQISLAEGVSGLFES